MTYYSRSHTVVYKWRPNSAGARLNLDLKSNVTLYYWSIRRLELILFLFIGITHFYLVFHEVGYLGECEI